MVTKWKSSCVHPFENQYYWSDSKVLTLFNKTIEELSPFCLYCFASLVEIDLIGKLSCINICQCQILCTVANSMVTVQKCREHENTLKHLLKKTQILVIYLHSRFPTISARTTISAEDCQNNVCYLECPYFSVFLLVNFAVWYWQLLRSNKSLQ